MDSAGSGFDSEIWGDAEQMLQAFRRQTFSVVVFRLTESSLFESTRDRIEADPRLLLEAKPEVRFYAEQSEALATTAPIEKITARLRPRMLMKVASASLCSA